MKKLTATVLTVALALSVVACGNSDSDDEGGFDQTIEVFCEERGTEPDQDRFEDDGDGFCEDGTEYDNPADDEGDEGGSKIKKSKPKKSKTKSTKVKRR